MIDTVRSCEIGSANITITAIVSEYSALFTHQGLHSRTRFRQPVASSRRKSRGLTPSAPICGNARVVTRWLLPLIAVLALCGRAVTAFAAAGWVGKLACCCPDPRTCKCHDHDGHRPDDAQLKRCGGDARLVAPDSPVVALVAPVPMVTETTVVVLEAVIAPAPRSAISAPPEPPPI